MDNPQQPAAGADVVRQMRKMTRRSFTLGGGAALAGLLGWLGIRAAAPDHGIPWPLRRVLEFNETVARAAFDGSRLAPDFGRERATQPRVNGHVGLDEDFDVAGWRLRVTGADGRPRTFTLADLQALPVVHMTTELRCIEGWSNIVHWSGVRLVDFAARYGFGRRNGQGFDPESRPADLLRYVRLATPDNGYYVGLDMASALHPQTLLCHTMNGAPLSLAHGAPLRLVIPVKYGIKNLKRIGSIDFTDERPADYWAERGYDWYAGH